MVIPLTPPALRAAVALAAGIVALSACSSSGGTASSAASASSTASTPAASAPEHIHAVVVDGAQTFLATHEGVFRLEGGRAVRVSDQPFDAMSLAGSDGLLLASGHPAPGTDFPDPLGLGRSTDGGRTWRPDSHLGVTDFHDVDVVGSRIWGVASGGTLWRSEDGGRQWSSSAVPPVSDLAAGPAGGSEVMAVSDGQVVLSNDGGASFSRTAPLPGATAVRVLWAGDDRLAVSGAGDVLAWSPSDGRWTRRGSLPVGTQAVGSAGADVLAVTAAALHRSTDGGRTFTVLSPISWP